MNYVQDGTLYLEDRNTNRITSLGRINNTVHEVMKITHGKAITSNTYISGTSLIDPVSLNIGIRQSIPYTYDSDLAMSSIYIESLLEDGWDIIGYYGDADYIDYFISKQGAVSRVILLSKSMKVFYDIQGDIPDPLKFTTKR
ncbi:hypothetical protein DFP95_1301 [Cohnella lupini]|uniref:Uncharacterized protein n=2 Tax=Cohnella lupini TaxID=1294267 RepID=A0A3D9HTK3_9BACL|nr:hypothetical protein DFP95_1301 [Cohnella lupini]